MVFIFSRFGFIEYHCLGFRGDMETNCLFCKIASKEIPAVTVFEDDVCVAFRDINPQAPIHVLLIPRDHVDSLAETEDSHKSMLGHLVGAARDLAADMGVAEDGYRLVVNTNRNGGQTVFHLHVHLLAGRPFIFPPG